jgi:ureidoacrylate peracid hydrolase
MHQIQIGQHAIDRVMKRRGKVELYDSIVPAKSALIVVDMQNCFVAPGMPAEISYARDAVPNINRLAAAFRAAGGHVVWIKNAIYPETRQNWSVWVDNMMSPDLREEMCREMHPGSKGYELWPELDVKDEDAQIEKTRFSAFIQGSSGLAEYLEKVGVDTIAITGTATQVCCESTARDGMMLNYKVIFVSDGCGAPTDADHNATLTSLLQSFCDIRPTDEVIALLEA